MKSPIFSRGLDQLVEEYRQHLILTAGLAPGTGDRYRRCVQQFLATAGHRTKRRLHELDSAQVLKHLLKLRAQGQPHQLHWHAVALRSFFRFLVLTGRAPYGLEQALPPIRLPRKLLTAYLSPAQVRGLLGAFDLRAPAGVRDQAMVLLAAKLGLRAKEIAQLSLEDVDWQAGTLCLRQTKGRRCRLLPLPSTVAQSLVRYVRSIRPKATSRRVFLCLNRPASLSSSAVSSATVAAFARAGLEVARPGPHLLRHTLATHLIQRGTDLKAIADVLGHRSLSTTARYAKVNVPMLAQVAQPWPEAK